MSMEQSVNPNEQDTILLQMQGFNESEISRLLKIKHKLEAGEFQETTSEAKRLEFIKWLYIQGKLKS